jgi:hypothetical protein
MGRRPGAQMKSLRSLGRLIVEFWWAVISLAAIVTFVFGYFGNMAYFTYLFHEGAVYHPPRPMDAAYETLKLFFMNGADGTHFPVRLQIAQFTAPIVSGSAALTGLAALFRDRVLRLRIPIMRGHVVVCGLGYLGSVFVRQLRLAGLRVVVVELDPANRFIEACRSLKIPVIVGDAQLERTLRSAGVRHAARLLAVCPDDAVNTEIVAVARGLVTERHARLRHAARLHAVSPENTANTGIVAVARRLATRRRRRVLRCLARIGDPALCRLLRIHEANLPGEHLTSLDFFNTDEMGARLWLDTFPVSSGRPHLLVSRFDGLGTWLVKHAAWGWFADRTDDTRLWVTVVDDEDAQDRVHALLDQYPALEEATRFVYCSASAHDIGQLTAQHATEGAPPVTRAYVTAYRDEDALPTALTLRQELGEAVPLVVALSRAHGVGRLISEASASGKLTGIEVYPVLERLCTAELVEGGSFERIAIAIHDRWRQDQLAQSKDAPTWRELDESRKESNRAQARDIPAKLQSIGCAIAPLRDWGTPDFAFSAEELEILAVAEHKRWIAERLESGWRLGDKDVAKKFTPYLIPFDKLTKEIADYDRDAVLEIPAALALIDLRVARRQPAEPEEPVDAGL